jgi:hypothetical protein
MRHMPGGHEIVVFQKHGLTRACSRRASPAADAQRVCPAWSVRGGESPLGDLVAGTPSEPQGVEPRGWR